MTTLFDPFALRGVTLRHRLVVPPMCQYSAVDGIANDWHFANYSRFAMGGAAMVIIEATAIDPRGRISRGDLGLWRDEQIAPMRSITAFLAAQDACRRSSSTTVGARRAAAGHGMDLPRWTTTTGGYATSRRGPWSHRARSPPATNLLCPWRSNWKTSRR